MLTYTLRRILGMIPTLLIISAVCFAVIKLQPGSFTDQYLEDPRFTRETAEAISRQLGLDQPATVQYGRWLWGVVTRLDFGYSFLQNRPVVSVIGELLGWTVFLSFVTLLFSWVVAVPLGLYTAFNRHGFAAGVANVLGYVGLAIPDFLAALLLVALLEAGGQASTGQLALAVSGREDRRERHGKQAVSRLARELRRALGWDGSVRAGSGAYFLDPGAEWTYDVHDLRAAGQPVEAFLSGVTLPWVLDRETELRQQDSNDLSATPGLD